jgi:hypothetical protein
MDTAITKSSKSIYSYSPLLLFIVIYSITCLIGALIILSGDQTFINYFKTFSGMQVPILTQKELAINLFLLIGAPILLCASYILTLKSKITNTFAIYFSIFLNRSSSIPWITANAIFYILALIALLQLKHAGSFHFLSTWLNYSNWILARWCSFESLSFFSFSNIYTFIPIAAIIVTLSCQNKSIIGAFLKYLPIAITLFIEILIFQKNPY